MSQINAPATLVTPAGTINFNPVGPATDYIWFNDVQGLDGVELRAPVDDAPLTDGGIWYDWLKKPRHITITGQVVGSTPLLRDTACDNLVAALESIGGLVTATGSYTWTPIGFGARHLPVVRCDQQILGFSGGQGGGPKGFVFGLVAINPAIS